MTVRGCLLGRAGAALWEQSRGRSGLLCKLEPVRGRCLIRHAGGLTPLDTAVESHHEARLLSGGIILRGAVIVLAGMMLLTITLPAFAENERQNQQVLVIGVGEPGSSSYRIGAWLTSLLRAGALPDETQTQIELWESLSPAERVVVLFEEAQLAVIPAGSAELKKPHVRQQVRAVISLADGNQVLARADLSDDFVYELTRLMFKNADPTRFIYCPEIGDLAPSASLVRLQGAAHPGALRFYEEYSDEQIAVDSPGIAVAPPDTAVAPPEKAVALPGTAVTSPDPAVAVPHTAVASPEKPVALPQAAVASLGTAVAVPETAIALPRTFVTLPTTDRSAGNPPGAVLSTNLAFGSEAEEHRAPRHRLELESSLGGGEVFDDARRAGHGQVHFSGRVGLADMVSLETEASLLHLRRTPDDDKLDPEDWEDELEDFYDEFRFLESPAEQEVNRVRDATVTLGLLDDRIRFTSRLASSTYARSDFRRKRPQRRPDDDDADDDEIERFQSRSGEEGSGRLQRLDASVWRAGDTELTLFGEYGEVGRYFESLVIEDDDPFATPNRERTSYGAILKQGPLELTLANNSSREASSEADETEFQYEVGAWVDLDEVSEDLLGLDTSHPLWVLAPSSVWVKGAQGPVEADAGGDDPDDEVRDFSAGLTWSGDYHYVHASYWESIYDYEATYGEDYDWVGRGGDLSFGVFGRRWGLDLSLTAESAEDLAPSSRTSEYGYDGAVTLSLRPDKSPEISIGLNVGRYDVDYQAYGGSTTTENWGIETVADLSKYLWRERPGSPPQLKLLYRFDNLRTRGEFSDDGDRMEHVLAVWYSLNF
jgi:hypothetical protein